MESWCGDEIYFIGIRGLLQRVEYLYVRVRHEEYI